MGTHTLTRGGKWRLYLMSALVLCPGIFYLVSRLFQQISIWAGTRDTVVPFTFTSLMENWVIWAIYGFLFCWVFAVVRLNMLAFIVAGQLGLALPMIIQNLARLMMGDSTWTIFWIAAVKWIISALLVSMAGYWWAKSRIAPHRTMVDA